MTIYSQIPAYTYKITCRPTGQFYFGYREGNIKKHRLPDDDLWNQYFTSSSIVKKLIHQYGKSAFLAEVIDTDVDPEKMYWQEQTYIKNNWHNELLLNQSFIDPNKSDVAFKTTIESNKKGVETRRRRGTDKIAATKMVETKRRLGTDKTGAAKSIDGQRANGTLHTRQIKIAETKRQRGTDKIGAAKAIETQRATGGLLSRAKKMVETKRQRGTDKIGAAKTMQLLKEKGTLMDRQLKIAENRRLRGTDIIGAQKRADIIALSWEVTYLDNLPIVIKNLAKFCRENKLDNSTMGRINGTDKRHKGWRCRKLN